MTDTKTPGPVSANAGTSIQLKECPFCGCAMHLESKRDWHHVKGEHAQDCVLGARTPQLSYLASDTNILAIAEQWDTRSFRITSEVTFPTMLRKMWSGGEVQAWLNTHVAPQLDMLKRAIAKPWCPSACPVTGREFFMWLDHPEHGNVPTYGGPFDSFTLAEQDGDGTYQCLRYDHDAGEWMEALEWINTRLMDSQSDECDHGEVARLQTQISELAGTNRIVMTVEFPTASLPVGPSLDDRLKSAGMLSVAELMAGAPLDAFMTHAGVSDLATFGQWVEMKRAEFLKLMARYDLGDKPKDDLYEWVVAHSAAFGEVHVNLKAALPAPGDRSPKDYAIEHAGYMATAADNVQAEYQAYSLAQLAVDEGGDDGADELAESVDAARDELHEALSRLRSMVYEFRKRENRAAVANQDTN